MSVKHKTKYFVLTVCFPTPCKVSDPTTGNTAVFHRKYRLYQWCTRKTNSTNKIPVYRAKKKIITINSSWKCMMTNTLTRAAHVKHIANGNNSECQAMVLSTILTTTNTKHADVIIRDKRYVVKGKYCYIVQEYT